MASLAWTDTNISTDKSALLALKSFITSDPFDFLAHWSVSSSPCNWTGVTCNTRHGRVHSLNLHGMGLKGSISPQLGNLSFLVELDLNDNNFYGQIPKDLNGFIPLSLFNLSRLETLDLRFNFIEGTIPLDVGRLERLKILRLGGNKISWIHSLTISNLSSLELLSLSYNNFSGGIPNEIGDLLSGSLPKNVCFGLPKLEVFYVHGNDLSGEIPSIWHQCKELVELHLGDNRFDEGKIPSDIGNLTKLQWIYLGNSNLQGEIPSTLFTISSLRIVNLARNNLNGSLPISIGNETLLEELYLSWNSFTGRIPSFLWNMPSLREVHVGSNHLKGNLPEVMCCQLPLLEVFEVDNNQLE
ncbi:hypothetical protein K1719_044416 [Acacia pycnantha]|nr:hypothetical protein K1719_044416 [Acacia pycnantha]